MKVLAFLKYGSEAASTRQRIKQYAEPLRRAGIELDHAVLLDDDYVQSLSSGARPSRVRILASYWNRMRLLLSRPQYDLVWVYADLFPYLPSAFDRLLFRLKRPVVVDWDDAFFDIYVRHPSRLVRAVLGRKLDRLLTRADAIVCGNAYLQDYSRAFNERTMIVPTVVNTDVYRPHRSEGPLTIGWIGSPSSWPNCRMVLPVIAQLCEEHDARFRVVGAGRVAEADRHPRFDFVDWSEDREVAEVQSFDIGIMPLIDGPFQRGKSGYKLVQYMACAIPSVASPVGVNSEMLEAGTGFLASDINQWRSALEQLMRDPELRARMGEAARHRAIAKYSLQSQAPRLIALFNQLAGR